MLKIAVQIMATKVDLGRSDGGKQFLKSCMCKYFEKSNV